jgi:hypothetical protein
VPAPVGGFAGVIFRARTAERPRRFYPPKALFTTRMMPPPASPRSPWPLPTLVLALRRRSAAKERPTFTSFLNCLSWACARSDGHPCAVQLLFVCWFYCVYVRVPFLVSPMPMFLFSVPYRVFAPHVRCGRERSCAVNRQLMKCAIPCRNDRVLNKRRGPTRHSRLVSNDKTQHESNT